MSDYKPGTLAMVTLDSGERVRAMRLEDEDAWRTQDDIWLDRRDGTETVSDVRPLVVLDLSLHDVEPHRMASFVVDLLRQPRHSWADHVADQIEAQTRPPKPPEPQGLGAVVEDTEGVLWTRCSRIPGHPWLDADDNHFGTAYEAIDVVRVLSDGWEPKP